MKFILRLLGIIAAAIGILLVVLVLYLAFGDLGVHKGRIESFVTRQIGRPFAIDGPFTLTLYPAIKMQADQVHIGNVSWSATPQLLQVGHVATQIDLWSLVSGPIIVRQLELRDVTVVLERNDKGENNWTFGDPNAPPPPKDLSDAGLKKLPVAFYHATLQNLHVTYRAAGKEERQARIESLTVLPGSDQLLSIEGKGSLDQYAAALSGQAGPLESLVAGRNIRMAINASLGNLRVAAKGSIGTLDPLNGADLQLTVDNPDLGTMLRKLSIPVFADGPMHLQATLADTGARTHIDVHATAGDITASVDGSLAVLGLRDSELQFKAQAPDAARLGAVFDIKDVPAEKLDVSGHVFITHTLRKPAGRSVRGTLQVALGDLKVDAQGTLGHLHPLDVTDLKLTVDDPDAAALLRTLKLPVLASGPMHLEASLAEDRKKQRERVQLQVTTGDIKGSLSGSYASPGLGNPEGQITAQVQDAAAVLRTLQLPVVAGGPMHLEGSLADDRKNQRKRVQLRVASDDIKGSLSGSFAPPGLGNPEGQITAQVKDAAAVLRTLQLPVVAGGPMHLEGSLTDDPENQRKRVQLRVASDDIKGSLSGSFAPPGLGNPEGQITAQVKDAARLAGAFDIKGIPALKLDVAGHVAVSPEQVKLDGVSASLGTTTHLKIDGAIARTGVRNATTRFDFSTDNLSQLKQDLPAQPAKVSGTLVSTPEQFEFTNLSVGLGNTRIAGTAKIGRTVPRHIEANLSSPLLDLTPLVGKPASTTEPGKPAPKPETKPEAKQHLFSTTPLPLDKLRGLDAHLRVIALELRADTLLFRSVDATVTVKDGHLQAQAKANGGYSGSLEGSVDVLPTAAGAAALKVNLNLRDLRAGFAGGDTVRHEEVPPTTLVTDLSANGNSPRQLASSINGKFLLSLGPGKTRKGALGKVGGDTISQLFSKLNPFAKEDPYTELDCTVTRVDFKHGKAAIAPVLVQTRKVTVTADGTVDLGTEALALNFNTRPRSGIGISPGMFTNPFLELRGTLLKPTVGVGAKGVTSGALAAATAGATVIAKGVVDRVKGEVDMCKKTLEEAQQPRPSKGQSP